MFDLNDLLKVQAKNAKQQRYLKCVDDGNNYWTIFRLMPRGRAVLRHVTDDEPLCQAQLLFLSGFGAGLLFCPPMGKSPIELHFAALRCSVLWHQFLQTSHGEIVLDGAAYPNTPTTLLNQALEIFIEGFCAGQHELRWRKILRTSMSLPTNS